MDKSDQQAIEALFGRLADVERHSPPRDGGAEAYIGEQLKRQPGAAYFMAQTIIVQEQALNAAQARIAELEREAPGALCDNREDTRPSGLVPRMGRASSEPPQAPPVQAMAAQRQGSGFLAGAAQTAMGVAGGLMLGSMLTSMFGGSAAQAATPPADAAPAPAPESAQAEPASFEDSDVGGFGDFEI
ncbi:DUF2076 domain-containing protein [Aestuariivirga sp. YIM B02566]|uniref:DUF2076 domain-containing protein n=1 Tax=Taklimakanibacter albus TaxID=2800327 RepID=A0ACC5QXP2_9HYPH|nr:DUF2076 domain-containing protein [Aestuariivirga sp. YIM B02566]MBK1865144.1 DUF2076 domain-containing protein [Aestuariivirga sp. YIM B02566]